MKVLTLLSLVVLVFSCFDTVKAEPDAMILNALMGNLNRVESAKEDTKADDPRDGIVITPPQGATMSCPNGGIEQEILDAYPAYNQMDFSSSPYGGDFSICYAIAATTMYDLGYASSPDDFEDHLTSPVPVAFKTKAQFSSVATHVEYGWPEDSGAMMKVHGSCDLRDYFDDNGDLVPITQAIGQLEYLYLAYWATTPDDSREQSSHEDRAAIVDEIATIINKLNPSHWVNGDPFYTEDSFGDGSQVCTGDQSEKTLKALITDQQRLAIHESLRRDKSYAFIDGVLDAACMGRTQNVPDSFGISKISYGPGEYDRKAEEINRAINRGLPIGIALSYSAFTTQESRYLGPSNQHAVVIVGQRFNEETNTCEVMVKDSTGPDCDGRSAWECQRGIHIMPRDHMLKATASLFPMTL